MFKIALNAGHGLNTPGKRCLKSIDPKQTREWYLNDRICDKIESKLKAYTGYELIRLDDTTGKTDVALKARTDKANKFKADFYLSIHHNAGVLGGKGGGVVAFTYKTVDKVTAEWQKELYNAIIKATGLKGNRATPLAKKDLHECRESNMPCVLLECGFMDSKTDTPIILTEDFAEKVATACVEVLVKKGGLKKKETAPAATAKIYRVQVGAFSNKATAEKLKKELEGKGYEAIIV
jgi:N-acetylmuramoyl-L-alanine amidase